MKARLLTIGEAARRLHLCVDKVRQLADDGELRAERTDGGHRRFAEADIVHYAERRGTAAGRHFPNPKLTTPSRRVEHVKRLMSYRRSSTHWTSGARSKSSRRLRFVQPPRYCRPHMRQGVSTFHPYLTLSEGVKLAAQAFTKDVAKLSCCAA
jgi:excisionase family DNA binding protein